MYKRQDTRNGNIWGCSIDSKLYELSDSNNIYFIDHYDDTNINNVKKAIDELARKYNKNDVIIIDDIIAVSYTHLVIFISEASGKFNGKLITLKTLEVGADTPNDCLLYTSFLIYIIMIVIYKNKHVYLKHLIIIR